MENATNKEKKIKVFSWFRTLGNYGKVFWPQFCSSNAEGTSQWEICFSEFGLVTESEQWEAASYLFTALINERNCLFLFFFFKGRIE